MGRLLGVIEIGSSSVRLKIVEATSSIRRVVLSERRSVKLGLSVLSNRGRLDPSAMNPCMEAVAGFLALLRTHGVKTFRVVVGAVVRESTNPDDLVGPLRTQLGVPVEVLSGEAEARYLFMALPRHDPAMMPTVSSDSATPSVDAGPLVTAMFELGAHSLQFACGVVPHAQLAGSIPLGASLLALQHGTHQSLDLAGLGRLDESLRCGLRPILSSIATLNPARVVGAGGPLGSLPRAARHTGRLPWRVTLVQARGLVARLGRVPIADRVALGIKEDRADTIVVGAAMAAVLLEGLRHESLWSVDTAVRDGVLIEMTRDARAAVG